MKYEFRGFYIPDRMMGGLTRYVEQGIRPGHFLEAVICNDLAGAVARADDENLANLPAYLAWLHNEAPSKCWGNTLSVESWIAKKRIAA